MIAKFKHIALMSVCLMSSAGLFAQQNQSKSNMNAQGQQNAGEESQVRLFGDFLWWKGQVEGTEYAQSRTTTGTLESPLTATVYKTMSPGGEWRPGLRLGLGYRFKQDRTDDFNAWTVEGMWTYLKSRSGGNGFSGDDSSSSSGSSPAVGYFKPLGLSTLGPRATTATSSWHMTMNIADLVASREYRPARKIVLRPFAGVRGAFFKFNQSQAFTSVWDFYGVGTPTPAPVPLLAAGTTQTAATSASSHFKYNAVGLKMGSDAQWQFNDCFSLTGKLGGSVVYGKYDIGQQYLGYRVNSVSQSQPLIYASNTTFTRDMWRVRANLETFLGFTYETMFADDACGFALTAGYEMTQWFQLNEIPHVTSNIADFTAYNASGVASNAIDLYHTETPEHGNVSFQGLTIRVNFDF